MEKKQNKNVTCIDCNGYSQCPMTGFEYCSKGEDLPNSKKICCKFEKNN